MKLKIRFPGEVLSFTEHRHTPNDIPPDPRERIEKRYIICLLCLWFIIFLFSIIRCNAQELKPLDTGTKVPNLQITHLINYTQTSANLYDFKDKLIIVNFWATWCGSCISSLPKVNKLQQEFMGKAVFLSVTDEKDATIKKFLARDPWYVNFHAILITDDKEFSKLFPHSYLPHIVVIRNGEFYQQWSEDNLNESNIREILDGKKLALTQKKDLIGFKLEKPLFPVSASDNTRRATYSMVITGYKPGLPLLGKEIKDSLQETIRYDLINHTLVNLYSIAMNSPYPHLANRRLILVKDSNKFLYHKNQGIKSDWERKNAVTYERTFPIATSDSAFQKQLKNDLDFYLGWRSAIEERVIEGFMLEYDGKSARHDPLKAAKVYIDPEKKIHYLHGVHAETLLRILNRFEGMPVVTDGTNLRTTFDIDFNAPPANVADWQAALKQAGLSLKPARMRVPMFVLTDVPGVNHPSGKIINQP